jgi:hypothetical protein
MKQIPLTKGKFTIVDDEDYEELSKYSWCLSTSGYARGVYKGKAIQMHRVINNTPIGMGTDHINWDRLDNRRSNLRTASRSQNQANIKKPRRHKGVTSQYKGVCWYKNLNKWLSSIMVDQKRIYLGYFENEGDAAKAYNKNALKYFGEFAYQNIITEDK